MIDVKAKELRVNALNRIDELSSELNKIVREMHEVSRTKIEERLPAAERKVRETELRYQIMGEYYKLLYYRDINHLKDVKAFTIVYNDLERETKENYDALLYSYQRLLILFESMEIVAGKTKTGFDYYENKFKEEYTENGRLWTEGYNLSFDIKNLNKETQQALNDLLEEEKQA